MAYIVYTLHSVSSCFCLYLRLRLRLLPFQILLFRFLFNFLVCLASHDATAAGNAEKKSECSGRGIASRRAGQWREEERRQRNERKNFKCRRHQVLSHYHYYFFIFFCFSFLFYFIVADGFFAACSLPTPRR